MLPNVYGWSWTPGHVIFVGLFFAVGLTVAVTVLMAWWRASRDLSSGRADAIRWREEFHDLPPDERCCRHQITGEFQRRECDKAFDCRQCKTHTKLTGEVPPADIYYGRGHTWVRPEPDGTLTVGLDEIASRLIGPGAQFDLPTVGTRLSVHAPAARAKRNGHDVRILSPVEGVVVGGKKDGALFRVKPLETPARLTHLLSGREADLWKMRELERLQILMSGSVPALADGGVLVDDLPAADPDADWSCVWGAMLLEP